MQTVNCEMTRGIQRLQQLGVSENVVYPIVPNGFADHSPCEQIHPCSRSGIQYSTHYASSRVISETSRAPSCLFRESGA